jgi:hypothetical protein
MRHFEQHRKPTSEDATKRHQRRIRFGRTVFGIQSCCNSICTRLVCFMFIIQVCAFFYMRSYMFCGLALDHMGAARSNLKCVKCHFD